mmetsp:Transcript_1602/g.3941  ORF Transcript_1602/g.3941 Transcript_1602/m.3941 type:complete len:211 (-) Transcript_1602:262-894(-)
MKPRVWMLQRDWLGFESEPVAHMVAASLGEAAACLVRVPTEVIKAKMQTSRGATLSGTIRLVWRSERHGPLGALTGGLYRGFGITLLREVPFAMIQFPLYEEFKLVLARYQQQKEVSPVVAALCGSISGGIAAAATTPLDVLKTRLMLGTDRAGVPYKSAVDVLQRTIQEEGYLALFHGIQPRVMWISIGGFVFFGAYEGCRRVITPWTG